MQLTGQPDLGQHQIMVDELVQFRRRCDPPRQLLLLHCLHPRRPVLLLKPLGLLLKLLDLRHLGLELLDGQLRYVHYTIFMNESLLIDLFLCFRCR